MGPCASHALIKRGPRHDFDGRRPTAASEAHRPHPSCENTSEKLPSLRALRLIEDRLRRPLLPHDAIAQEAHAVGDVSRERHLVRRHHDGEPTRRQLPDGLKNLVDEKRVECGGDLVEQRQLRLHGQGADDRHALDLSAEESIRVVAGLRLQSEALEQNEGLLPGFVLGVMGIFQPGIRELKETDYQRQRPYILDDGAARTTFALEPTPWAEIIDELVSGYRRKMVA